MLKKGVTLALGWALLVAPAAAQEASLDDILSSYYEAIGGLEAWKSIQSMKISGKMTARRGMEVPFTRLVKRPDKVRVEFTMQGMTGTRAFDGTTAWMLMPFRGNTEPEVMSPQMARGLKEDADIGGPLLDYEAKGNKVELLGLAETGGTEAYKLEVTLKDGEVRYYYLDREYNVPIMVSGTRQFRGDEMEFETILSDYKEVGGLLIAHSVQTRPAGGRGGQVLTIERVELNIDIDDAIFTMPEKERDGR
ncbi:MAG: hypothetical protein V3U13_10095 [Gemmatimonadota bacterium]